MLSDVASLTSALADRYGFQRELGSGGMAPRRQAHRRHALRRWSGADLDQVDRRRSAVAATSTLDASARTAPPFPW